MASLINPGIWEGQGVTGGSRPNPHQRHPALELQRAYVTSWPAYLLSGGWSSCCLEAWQKQRRKQELTPRSTHNPNWAGMGRAGIAPLPAVGSSCCLHTTPLKETQPQGPPSASRGAPQVCPSTQRPEGNSTQGPSSASRGAPQVAQHIALGEEGTAIGSVRRPGLGF